MKVLGAVLVTICCGWFGFSLSASHKKEEHHLRQFISALECMQNEIQFRLSSLPVLFQQAANVCSKGAIRDFFLALSEELNQQIAAEVQPCLQAALDRTPKLTPITQQCIGEMGKNLGKFDLEGQISGFESTKVFCKERLDIHCAGKDEQRRSYQTLGICAGAALVIILI